MKKAQIPQKRPPKTRYVHVESKNALLELLQAGEKIDKIFVANNAYRDMKTKLIVAEAGRRGVPMEKVTRKRINRLARTKTCESIVGLKPIGKELDLSEVLAREPNQAGSKLFLILDHVEYGQNLGAITRTGFGAKVDGIIIPKRKNRMMTDDVTRISMGASERVPVMQMSLFDAIKRLKDDGFRIVAVHMEGKMYYDEDLTGNVALVLGGESEGISSTMLEKCDAVVSLPMQEGIGSLNVGATAAVLMYEKRRQDGIK